MRFDGTGGPKIGLFADSTDLSMPIVDLARAAEDRGFSGLFLNEHPHMPVSHPRSPWPHGGPVPPKYARFWDPYVALSFVAAHTRLEVGPCISLIAEHDPIALAKTVATLDVLSGGRLILGVGYGWNREEFEDHGRPAAVRAHIVGETLALMKELWTKEEASFAGSYLSLSPSRAWPKPLQKPHPPVLMGVPANKRNYERIARWADGWIPMRSPLFEPDFGTSCVSSREEWELAGRAGQPSVMVMLSTVPTTRLADAVERARALEVERLLVKVPDDGADEVERLLDRAAAALEPAV